MRRLEEYIFADRTPYFHSLHFLSSPLICDVSFSLLFTRDKILFSVLSLSPLFALLCHSRPTKWASRESWNMLTFTDRCEGRRREDDEKTKDVEGLDHKGCGGLDFTGRRVLGNYRTFKIQKVLIARYPARDTSVVKSSVFNTATHACKHNYKKIDLFMSITTK